MSWEFALFALVCVSPLAVAVALLWPTRHRHHWRADSRDTAYCPGCSMRRVRLRAGMRDLDGYRYRVPFGRMLRSDRLDDHQWFNSLPRESGSRRGDAV